MAESDKRMGSTAGAVPLLAGHTPGPWELETITCKSGRNKLALRCASHRICDINVFNETDHANARLIAAAPELLAELKSMTLLFKIALLSTTLEIAKQARPLIDKAEAAIAKAEG